MKKGLLTLGLLVSATGLVVESKAAKTAISGRGRSAAGIGCSGLSYCPADETAQAQQERAAKRAKVDQQVQQKEGGKAKNAHKAKANADNNNNNAGVQVQAIQDDIILNGQGGYRAVGEEAVSIQAIDPATQGTVTAKTSGNGPQAIGIGIGPVRTKKGNLYGANGNGPATGAVDVVVNGQPSGSARSDLIIFGQLTDADQTALKDLSSPILSLSQRARRFGTLRQGLLNLKDKAATAQAQAYLQGVADTINAIAAANNIANAAQVLVASEALHQELQKLPTLLGREGQSFKKLQERTASLTIDKAKSLRKAKKPVVAALLLKPLVGINKDALNLHDTITKGFSGAQQNRYNIAVDALDLKAAQ